MDRSQFEVNLKVIGAATASTFTSSTLDKGSCGNVTIQVVSSGSATNVTYVIEGSMDANADQATGNWVSIPYITPTNPSSSTASVSINTLQTLWYHLVPLAYRYVRVRCTLNSGMTVTVTATWVY